jgi:hypothetical protein
MRRSVGGFALPNGSPLGGAYRLTRADVGHIVEALEVLLAEHEGARDLAGREVLL